jgi:hypothetical protein
MGRTRAAAAGAAFAVFLGTGVAAAGPPPPADAADAAGEHVPAQADVRPGRPRLQRSDLASAAALRQAYRSSAVFFLFGGGADAVPVPDLDADRAQDVLEMRTDAATGPEVALRSGRRGVQRWRTPTPDLLGAEYLPAPGGKPLVLAYRMASDYQGSPVADVVTLTLVVQALDARTGAEVWSTSRTGVLTYGIATEAVYGIPFVGGLLAGSKGHPPALLVTSYDYLFGGPVEHQASRVELVDTRTGETYWTGGTGPGLGGDESYGPAGDVDRDGLADLATVAAAGHDVTIRSGADGTELWRTPLRSAFDSGWPEPSPDLDGDRVPDLLVSTTTYDERPGIVSAVSGRTGTLVWSRTSNGTPRPAGDADGDGRSDTRLMTYADRSFKYEVVSGRGRTLWSTTVTNTRRDAEQMSWLAGDLDGDRVQDTYVRIVDVRSERAQGISSFVVNGRTGRVSAHRDLGVPLGESLDGRGDDFVRTRVVLTGGAQRVVLSAADGRTDRLLWDRVLPVASDARLLDWWTIDSTGSGRRDLLAVLAESGRAVVAVQDGRTGKASWSGAYATARRGYEEL